MKLALLVLCGGLWSGVADADVLKGVVRDSSGAPVFGADFDVFAPDGSLLPQDDNTDADGTYTITLPAGHYDVVCSPPIGSHLAARVMFDVVVSGVTRLNWVMAPSVRVIGRVLGPGGTPVSGADLDFDRIDDGTRQPAVGDKTSIFGTFAAYVQAGEYRVTVTPAAGVDLAPSFLAFLRVPTADTLRFVLAAAVHLSGTVRDPSGAGVPGARLSFRRAANGERVPSWGHFVDAAGAFRAGVAADSYRVLVQPPRGSRLAAVRTGSIDLRQDRGLDVTLPAGLIVSGTVLDREHRPVVGASWDAIDEATETVAPTPDDKTDYTGRFAFALPAGVYRFTLKPPPSSGLDSLVFPEVRVARDTVLDVAYRDPGSPERPSIDLLLLGSPRHRDADFRLLLPEAGRLRIEIFDAAGGRVRRLLDDDMPAGVHDLHWDGNRQNGAQAHTGIYFVRATQGAARTTRRLVLLP